MSHRPHLFTRISQRLLDSSHRGDILLAATLGTSPALLAWIIGANGNITIAGIEFAGYWTRPNWMVHIVSLPGALFLYRWASTRIAPVFDTWPPRSVPEVVRLIETERGQERAYASLRAALLSPANAGFPIIGLLIFHVFDMWEVISAYLVPAGAAAIREPDWAVMGAVSAEISWTGNLALVALAYAVQFSLLFLLVSFVTVVLRHNLFFLAHTYQTRRVPAGHEEAYFVIDMEDPNRCFGFRRANEAFNTQVLCLTVAGLGLLFTRFANVSTMQSAALFRALSLGTSGAAGPGSIGDLFPDIGQWVTAICWLLSLAIIAIPAMVKLLPRLPFTGGKSAQQSIVTYLHEFLPDSRWPYGVEPSVEEVNVLAARFADNAFWPTGNNRAAQLFFFSFWVFLVILAPLPSEPGRGLTVTLFYLTLAAISLVLTTATLQLLKWSLAYIDVRLVKAPVTIALPISSPSLGGSMGAKEVDEVQVKPGALLGEFRIQEHLASGGMGAVYRATDIRLGRQVALKVLPREFVQDAERLARFEREAQTLASLTHPHIATLFAFGQHGDTHYLAMELVEGETLAERLQDGPLSLDDALEVAEQIAAALEQAHRGAIVHRDLKPANVMLTDNGAKLLDFGLAKSTIFEGQDGQSALGTAAALTTQGTILGTLHYMAPEQLQAQSVDRRADIFAFGATLFEMLTGEKAFPGDSQATVIGEILHREPGPLTLPGDVAPVGLEALLRRCLAKKPSDRWQDTAELHDELKRLRSGPSEQPLVETATGAIVTATVAVLPFAWSDGTAEQVSIAEGITEQITIQLGQEHTGPVASYHAAQSLGGGQDDPRRAREMLGAGLLVQGSLRGSGNKVRLSVQLISTDTGHQLWGGRFDAILEDALDLQDDLAGRVMPQLLEQLRKG